MASFTASGGGGTWCEARMNTGAFQWPASNGAHQLEDHVCAFRPKSACRL